MITEEFSFPIITGNNNCTNVVHLTVLPPLWTRSPSYSCSASDHHSVIRRNRFLTRSFSHVEAQLLLLKPQDGELVGTEIQEEKMDMLWEDFNTDDSLVVPHKEDHLHCSQSPAVSVLSSPACSSSPVFEMGALIPACLSPPPSSDPHLISIPNANCSEGKGKGKELASGSFEGELEIRSSSNLMMIVTKEDRKKSKKKKKKVVQESILRMMKKFFQLKNITAFKFHKNKN